MKATRMYMHKILFIAALAVVGVFLAPSAQAYTASPYQYQFDNGQFQYQVYSAPVQVSYQTQFAEQRLQMLLQQIAQLQQLLRQMQQGTVIDFDYDWDDDYEDTDSEVEIETRSASDVQDDSARLRGEVSDFNRSNYADVWFEYGRSRDDLDKRTPIMRIDEDEDEDFSQRIGGLRDDTRYYYRAVGEDDDDEKDYGSIVSFETDDGWRNDDDDDWWNDDYDEEPRVTTRSAFDIDEDSARFEGSVDMNDFRNGEVFFVYGEDEDDIEDVADDFDSYSDVDEDGDDLQKFRLDSDLDSDSDYEIRVDGLDDDTDYYFVLCVGYEDEDDDEVLECSSVRDFTTDED
jgi:hypothetical protein